MILKILLLKGIITHNFQKRKKIKLLLKKILLLHYFLQEISPLKKYNNKKLNSLDKEMKKVKKMWIQSMQINTHTFQTPLH